MMNRAFYWDMDGTMADLYSVENWLSDLRAEKTRPYEIAAPIFDPYEVYLLLEGILSLGIPQEVISWGSMGGSREYNKQTKMAKVKWLDEMGILDCFDSVHVVKYGTPKHHVAKIKFAILIDDSAKVRADWIRAGGFAIDPTDPFFFQRIEEILEMEVM